MMSRMTRAATLAVAVLATLSCSKTADTAPERRVFGDPPTIQSVNFNFETNASATCDFAEIVLNQFCESGINDIQLQAGVGWNIDTSVTPHRIYYAPAPSPGPGIFIQGTYSRANFAVKVTDPNSVQGVKNDVLLVSSSFLQAESNSEVSLVLFDDGSSNKFNIGQTLTGQGEACGFDADLNTCVCRNATYEVTSGDTTPNDSTYGRKVAFPNRSTSGFLKDCIMRANHENANTLSDPGTRYDFKIEAVDREGNLSTWPTKVSGTTGNDTFACNGDPCGCCYLYFVVGVASQDECGGLDGMVSPSFFPNGFCHFLNGT